MAERTEISWTCAADGSPGHTFNPVKGCTKVSAGCKNCYAEADTKRYGLKVWGPGAPRIRTAPDYWKQPHKWNKRAVAAGVRERVFCASWADVGEDHPDWVEPRRDLARLIEATPGLDWLLLTKRPENLVRLFRDAGWAGSWPENVWAGATVENQEMAHERIPHLLGVPARVRFLSCEPLLGPVDVSRWMWPVHWTWDAGFPTPEAAIAAGASASQHRQRLVSASATFVNWVIVGGEGNGGRPFDLAWARSIRDQCKAAGVPFFCKQMGRNPLASGSELPFKSRNGTDPDEWPSDLRVQEFPR